MKISYGVYFLISVLYCVPARLAPDGVRQCAETVQHPRPGGGIERVRYQSGKIVVTVVYTGKSGMHATFDYGGLSL